VPRTRPPYPEEFRREAIKLALLGDKPQRQLAKDLGISDVTLRNWIKLERAEKGERAGGLSSDEREELQRLRDENAKLRMEREILSKAAVFFAKPYHQRRLNAEMACARRVLGAAKAAAQRAGVAAEGEILEGAPARRVLEFAHHRRARLIVLGSRRRRFGTSVSRRVIRSADRPVVVAGASPTIAVAAA
jgi:transposase